MKYSGLMKKNKKAPSSLHLTTAKMFCSNYYFSNCKYSLQNTQADNLKLKYIFQKF